MRLDPSLIRSIANAIDAGDFAGAERTALRILDAVHAAADRAAARDTFGEDLAGDPTTDAGGDDHDDFDPHNDDNNPDAYGEDPDDAGDPDAIDDALLAAWLLN